MRADIELNSLALKTRKQWGEDSYSPVDIFALVNGWKDRKITVVSYPLSARMSGLCTKMNDNIIICINSASSYGRQRFTLAHELYHVLYEEGMQNVICDMTIGGNKTEVEREADKFASYLLMPYDALKQYSDNKNEWSLENVIEAEQFFQISHDAMLFRLVSENFINEEVYEAYRKFSASKEATRLGYSRELYCQTAENRRYFTTGEYIRKVEFLVSRERISEGKREEMLMEAFRPDIVYNLGEEGIDIEG